MSDDTHRRPGRPRKIPLELHDPAAPGIRLELELLTRLSEHPLPLTHAAAALGLPPSTIPALVDHLRRRGLDIRLGRKPGSRADVTLRGLWVEPVSWPAAQQLAEEYYDRVYGDPLIQTREVA